MRAFLAGKTGGYVPFNSQDKIPLNVLRHRSGKGIVKICVCAAAAMKGEGRNYYSSSTSYSRSDSESSSSYSSPSSSSSSSRSSSGCKRKRKHRSNGKRSKHTHKSKTDNHRNLKLKKSASFREDSTKEKARKRAKFAVKFQCESSVSEDEERMYKKKKNEKERRQRNKHRKQKKSEPKHQTEACNAGVLYENALITGKTNDENTAFQVLADAKEQQKAIIKRNAELAKARLASGELQRARNEQMKMQDLYGFVDWRAKKKLRKEKRILERTVATGKKLASLDERETARMDAFRIAVGLPTAEAQRQAEWRAHATESLAEFSKGYESAKSTSRHSKVIGPCLPRS
ncbi:hypothetical protein SUGI_0746700 [Cryptomeria japonica]|uniref:uncharacterized protein LOC131061653 n=1 Tax=Cryptomeria japonica TaxID=3369 RepID=UPI0024148EA0|nr:uncharacterized protein LOC131061653 [Cryptomeria japonica]GLJ36930.1 hypothetical protein SUGI_0746700 [Cryptomeria japonica]